MSATSLNKAAGARSRLALMVASVVLVVVILAFASLVGHIAMPALAGLLMLVGYRTIKPGTSGPNAPIADRLGVRIEQQLGRLAPAGRGRCPTAC